MRGIIITCMYICIYILYIYIYNIAVHIIICRFDSTLLLKYIYMYVYACIYIDIYIYAQYSVVQCAAIFCISNIIQLSKIY